MAAVTTLEPTLPPFPDGWYFLARTDELGAGAVLTRRLAGEDVVLFRTAAGALAAVRPHCPHLGAHLGHGGTVEGDTLRCPMHGFRYGVDGRCAATGYRTPPPPTATLDVHRVIERHGLILVWHSSARRAPSWDVPDRPTDGFSSLRTRTLVCAGHPQETSENAVDLGHLDQVHAFFDVAMTAPLAIDGPHLIASFAFSRQAGFFGRRAAVRAHYTAHVHGLGYSFVDVELPALGMRTQQYVLATPTDPGRLALTIGMRASAPTLPAGIHPLLGLVPRALVPGRLVAELASFSIMLAYVREVGNDIAIWKHKRYRPRPALAQGDGPIGAYRRWARQFYGAGAAVVDVDVDAAAADGLG
jgi:nitrite reductase/ring-hydroxylating ferredoxin subunit